MFLLLLVLVELSVREVRSPTCNGLLLRRNIGARPLKPSAAPESGVLRELFIRGDATARAVDAGLSFRVSLDGLADLCVMLRTRALLACATWAEVAMFAGVAGAWG